MVEAKPTHPLADAPSTPERLLKRFLPEDNANLRVPAYFSKEERAQAELNAGLYRRAIYSLYGAEPTSPLVPIIRSRAHAALGEDELALTAVADSASPKVKVERGRLLVKLGRQAEALTVLKDVVAAEPDNAEARFELGQVAEAMGDFSTARDAYQQLYSARKTQYKTADELVLAAKTIDRWATLEGRYRDNARLNEEVLGMFVQAYDVLDRGHPGARIAAAQYLYDHDQSEKAVEELEPLLAQNPRHAEAMELMGRIAISRFNFEAAEALAREIRKTNPTSLTADLLDARSQLQARRPDLAEPLLQGILKRQPNHLEALGLLASVYSIRLEQNREDEALARATSVSPNSPVAYYELAEQLSQNRQYPRAERMYLKAIELAPWLTKARNGLGLLYTQWGNDDKAAATLEEAYRLDPYNLETINYLRLLDRLKNMASVSSDHFVVRYDAAADPIIGSLMLEYMESVNAELVKIFEHQPTVSTYIEVFPTHAQFSVRTAGIPFIGTVGASTGRIIALVSPRDGKETMGTYNWAQVLRHEYGHTVTLSATENRIPHWMTEGLAVYAEEAPLRWEWVPLLYRAVTKDELFPIDRVTWGFVRPKKPTDRSLAYAQSYWMCKYLVDSYGKQAMLQLMAKFKEGKSQEQAFEEVLSMPAKQFHADFVDFAKREVGKWGYDRESQKKYDALREAGEAQIKEKKYKEAAVTWEEIAALRPADALPHQRLAGLYLTKDLNDPNKARKHLEVLNAVELKDNRYAKRLARLADLQNDVPGAIKFAKQAIWCDPYDADAHELLLSLARKANDEKLTTLQTERLQAIKDMKKPKATPPDPNQPATPIEPG